MSTFLRMTGVVDGLISNGYDFAAAGSVTGGTPLTNGTAVVVAAANLSTSGAGVIPAGGTITVTVAGGIVSAAVLGGGPWDGFSIGDTITIAAAGTGVAPASEWGTDITITLSAIDVQVGYSQLNVPLDNFGCIDPQAHTTDSVQIDLIQPGLAANYKITFNGMSTSALALKTAVSVSDAIQVALQSTSDVILNPYLPTGVTPAQVVYELA